MLPRETTQVSDSTVTQTRYFDIPEEILSVLPSDPFVQLDVARKIASIALSTRISKLEFECSHLRSIINEKDQIISDLQDQVRSLDASLAEIADRVSLADQEKESLLKENASLSRTINKLNRDVSKLESFRKTLKQSLEEEEEGSVGRSQALTKKIPQQESLSSASFTGEDDASATAKSSSMQSQFLEAGNSFTEDSETDASRSRISQGLPLASQTSMPRLTPLGSPPSLSASVSPMRISKPALPRRHSISLSTKRGMFDDKSSISSSVSPRHHSSITSSAGVGSQTGQTRVDGKEFFRQVRTRLSLEQFSPFLANVKELNSHKQTREETLRKADEILGPENKDLYSIFEGLITRNIN